MLNDIKFDAYNINYYDLISKLSPENSITIVFSGTA